MPNERPLRDALIRLAHQHRELRPHVLPLIKEAGAGAKYTTLATVRLLDRGMVAVNVQMIMEPDLTVDAYGAQVIAIAQDLERLAKAMGRQRTIEVSGPGDITLGPSDHGDLRARGSWLGVLDREAGDSDLLDEAANQIFDHVVWT